MENRTVASILVVALVTGSGVGYLVGQANQPDWGRCTPWGSLQGSIPAGINVTVSYQGRWWMTMAEFASNQTKASTLDSTCYYEGNNRISFYVSIANYQGWNTIDVRAHKWGTSGTMTVAISAGPSTSSNSTATPYGDATTTLSFLR